MSNLLKQPQTTIGSRRPAATVPGLDAKIIPVRHYGRWIFSAIVILVLLQVIAGFATNPYIDWSVIGDFLFNGGVLKGLWVTLQITAISVVAGLILAVVLAVMRLTQSTILRTVASSYIFVFRGLPLIVLLIFVGNIGLFIKEISFGIPGTDIVFFSAQTQQLITPFVASIIGLSIAASAYMSEIVRGGLLAVNPGQHQASKALGLTGGKSLRYIILPQALRVIVPPMGNELINTLKASALVSVIAGGDLLTMTQSIAGTNYKTIELMIVATIWYMLVISIFSIAQYFLERRTAEK